MATTEEAEAAITAFNSTDIMAVKSLSRFNVVNLLHVWHCEFVARYARA